MYRLIMIAVLLVCSGCEFANELRQLTNSFIEEVTTNDAEAQYQLGLKYNKGEGVSEDDVKAVNWYRKAANQGHAKAQFKLGAMYVNGEGVPEDDAEAVRWFRKAAEQGHALAQYSLGYKHYTGDGVLKDYTEAVKWFNMAAAQGNSPAQYYLGLIHSSKKEHHPDDLILSYMWLNLASIQGDEFSGLATKLLSDIEKDMSDEQFYAAQKASRDCLQNNYKECWVIAARNQGKSF